MNGIESDDRALIAEYWRTSISNISPGHIAFRGYAIQDLIGNVSFPEMIWLMLRGDLPHPDHAKLLEAALVASVDHGPHAPSIAISRMAVSCGLPVNGAMASALNTLGDVHGGAGEQALSFYTDVAMRMNAGEDLDGAAASAVDELIASGKYLPGFGHRFHPVDPRTGPLLDLVANAASRNSISGCFAQIARAIEVALRRRKGRLIPINIDGATAVIYGELGFTPFLARGIFCLSRSVGILAHASEQSGKAERNKGPIPRSMDYRYDGPPARATPWSSEASENPVIGSDCHGPVEQGKLRQ